MPDNLRDRIAAVIDSIRIQRDGDSYKMADAVIAELGLWQQFSNWHPGHYRYVTDWEENT